jgi:CheY-like chemotaxis protein
MPSILLLEDEFIIRMVLAEELRELGYEVQEAGSADEALAARFQDFSLLITDLSLGSKITGWDVALRAREQNPEIKVIYLTGYTTEDPRALPGGIMLMKPCPMPQVVAALAKLGLPTAPS